MTIEQIEKWNDYLMHAPAGIVVAAFSIALGYILTRADFFPNRFVPLVIVLFTAVLFPLVQFCADIQQGDASAGLKIILNAMIGFVIGFAAWAGHAAIISKFFPNLLEASKNKPASTNAPQNNNMKNTIIVILLALSIGMTAKAQTNLTQVPDLLGTNGPISISGSLGQVWTAFTQSGVMQATNYALAPYLTYAPKAPEKVGGGLLAIYNVSDYVGAALGVDYLGSFSLVSGNVTLKADTQPLKTITWLSWAPDTVRNVTITPFSLLGVGQPLGGTSGQGAATIWDIGGEVKFGHLFGGRFGAGATWGEWQNAGAYSGHRYHAFLSWQKGF